MKNRKQVITKDEALKLLIKCRVLKFKLLSDGLIYYTTCTPVSFKDEVLNLEFVFQYDENLDYFLYDEAENFNNLVEINAGFKEIYIK